MGLDLDDEDNGPPNPAQQVANLIELGRDVDGGINVREMLDKIPNARHIILATAFRCLGARKWYFEKGDAAKKFEPDYKTQLEAVKLLLAYQDGLPVTTSLNVSVGNAAGAEGIELDLAAAVKASPALRQRLEKLVGPAVETGRKP